MRMASYTRLRPPLAWCLILRECGLRGEGAPEPAGAAGQDGRQRHLADNGTGVGDGVTEAREQPGIHGASIAFRAAIRATDTRTDKAKKARPAP